MKKMKLIFGVVLCLLILVSCGGTTAASTDDDEIPACPTDYTENPASKAELKVLIDKYIADNSSVDLSRISTTNVTDMSELFKDNTDFNGDISCWDMSSVANVKSMFEGATNFNQDLSSWVLKAAAVVKDSTVATKMFYFSGMKPGNLPGNNFYQYTPTSKAELQTAITTEVGKQGTTADLSIIDTSGVTDMSSLFANDATFNGYISTWVMSGVTTVTSMFENATNFNQDLSGWVLKAGVIAKGSNKPTKMFYKSGMLPKMLPTMNFYQYTPADLAELKAAVAAEIDTAAQGSTADLSIIDTSKVTDMSSLFKDKTTFNGYVATWDTSKIEDMSVMFLKAEAFNQPIGNWDTSKVTGMSSMFQSSLAFNQPIGNWKTGNVESMAYMFAAAKAFNQPLKDWDTRKVENFSYMFFSASAFNQDIKSWSNASMGQAANLRMFSSSGMSEDNRADWMPTGEN